MDASPPALPPRAPSPDTNTEEVIPFQELNSPSSSITAISPTPTTSTPPALPARQPSFAPIYNLESSMALILIYRQAELLERLEMATPVGALANLKVDLRAKIAESLQGEEAWAPSEEFWVDLAHNYCNKYIRCQDLSIFEQRVIKGVPHKIRATLYLKVLNVRSIMDPKNYQALLRKTRAASYDDLGLSKSSVSAQSDAVQVFEICAKESTSATSHLLNGLKLQFIGGFSSILKHVSNLNTQEELALLFRIDAVFQKENWEENYYKATCGLEELVPSVSAHLKKHDVDGASIFKNVTFNLLSFLSGEESLSLAIADLFVFEGFDYFLRLAIAMIQKESATILSLEGSELHKFLGSHKFLQCVDDETVSHSIHVSFSIIRFENKFKLANSNFCSGNDNELSNLKESEFELQARLAETKSKLAHLQKVHAEVQQDIGDYNKKLKDSVAEKELLMAKKTSLEEQYSHLTMNENLTNTIKANHDISTANAELLAQVQELRDRVVKKREKMKKRGSPVHE